MKIKHKSPPRHPRGSKTPAKTPPRRSQDAPRRSQHAPETLPRRPKTPPGRLQDGPRSPQDAPKTPQERLRTSKDAPKSPPSRPRPRFWDDIGTILLRFSMILGSILMPLALDFSCRPDRFQKPPSDLQTSTLELVANGFGRFFADLKRI